MFAIIGIIVVFGSVIGGYVALGGHLGILMQPFELLIIGGAGIGAFIIANPKSIIGKMGKALGAAFKGASFKKQDYIELLSLLSQIFKMARTKGMLSLESHIENPKESPLFSAYPGFMKHHHAQVFLCDYLRLLTLGTDNPHELEALMDAELEHHHEEENEISNAMQTLADSFPALGIVAAVLGVIKTMTYITAPPAVLGEKIAAALVGTFLGILLCYGLVGPLARVIKQVYDTDARYLQCIKAGLIAHVSGYAPAISVEFARKAISTDVRPSFIEVEEAIQNAPAVA